MTVIHPLFVCCKHGEFSYDGFPQSDCCGHTVGFNKNRMVTPQMMDNRFKWMVQFKHGVKK